MTTPYSFTVTFPPVEDPRDARIAELEAALMLKVEDIARAVLEVEYNAAADKHMARTLHDFEPDEWASYIQDICDALSNTKEDAKG
jgi:hypothetical protein